MSRQTIGAILWSFCFQFFIAERIVRNAWIVPYSWSGNFISDLAAVHCANRIGSPDRYICSPLHGVMNASFIFQGVLIAGGALLLAGAFPVGRLRTTGLWLLGIAGVSVFVVGLAPEDVLSSVHFAAAGIHFICANLGMILIGAVLPRRMPGYLSMLAGGIGLIALLLLASGQYLGCGGGGMERVAAYPFTLWLIAMGIYLLITRGKPY